MSTLPLIARRQAAKIGAGLSFAMATGASAAEPLPGPSLPPSQTPGVAVPPGQIDQAIAKLDGLIKDLLNRSRVPGFAVAVVRDGKTVYAKGFGVREVGAADAVDADTVFQLASVSKSVSATVVARQVGLGGIAWSTPIIRHLPWFALNDRWITQHVTLADMFAHRSGLPDHAGDDLEDLGYDRRQVLERLRWLPLHSFRDEYAYTNFGVTAAAEAAAVAAGTDWASLAEKAVYGPLGMSSTSSRFKDFERQPNWAVGHVKISNQYVAKYQRQPDAQSPAGGVSSSVRDIARWLAMVLQGGTYDGNRIVAQDALLPAVTAQVISDHGSDMTARPGLYGYGFGVGIQPSGRVTMSHSGAFSMGAATNFVLIPSLGVGIIALSNAFPVGAVEALTASFADLVQFGTVTRDWLAAYGKVMVGLSAPVGSLAAKSPPQEAAPPANLQNYAGAYGNDYYGNAEILRRGDGLALRIGPKKLQYPLRHWDGSVFVYTPEGENAPDGSVSAITFKMRNAGHASAFSNDFYASSGRNEFVRR